MQKNEKKYRILGNGKNFYIEELIENRDKGISWMKVRDNNENTMLFESLEKAEEYVNGLKGLSYEKYKIVKEL